MPNELQLALPDIDPDEPVVQMRMIECRTCHGRSDWIPGEGDSAYEWQVQHAEQSGRTHTRFYVWSIGRNTSRQVWM